MQVNVAGSGFQWHPHLTWCGSSLWALWANGTGDLQGDDSFQGPVVRRLVADGRLDPADEVHLRGGLPLSAALSCADDSFLGRGGDSTVVALWLEPGGREVRWEYIRSSGSWQLQILSRLFMHRRLQLRTGSPQPDAPSRALGSDRLQQLAEASKLALDPGQVQMLAHGDLMMLLTKHRSGVLGAQLVQYISARPITFSRRMLASNSLSGSASWDTYAEQLAIVSCWATGGDFGANEPSAFECARHSAGWLADDDWNGPSIVLRCLGAVLGVAAICWSLVRAAHRLLCPGTFASGRSGGRRGQRSSRSRRLRDVRRQLAQIPGTPRRNGSMSAADDDEAIGGDSHEQLMASTEDSDGDASEEDAETPPETCRPELHDRDTCPICQERVGVWVALRPCGHTACRHCTLKLAETSLRCHMCRSSIKGVQPVYI
eukprot:gb/GFBE01059488.1/.p1 GENE.gb/GFBE01059488.1/~~gb/GFBE01059488.1/.p1  ORF type:complete len:431 (+),score=41.88 gb/GFBE01059488.1/:1-1293(+)